MILALVFVSVFAGTLASIAGFNNYQIRESEAKAAAWEIIEIAKAARLYMRDRMVTDPNILVTAATPARISIGDLRRAGYLSDNFLIDKPAARNARGLTNDERTALNQNIFVIMTNWPMGAATADTVPTAFVYVRDSSRSDAQLMIKAVELARQQKATFTAPKFVLSAGNWINDSDNCRTSGLPANGLWDTGCLTRAEFITLMNAIPAASRPGANGIAAGDLIIPSWKVVQPDMRAVMRFPQPENPGFATMLTDIKMGTPVGDCTLAANQLKITTTNAAGNPVEATSSLCDVQPDAVGVNRRFNITGVSNMTMQRLIAAPQAATDVNQDGTVESANIGNVQDDALRINGALALNNDLRIFNTKSISASGIPYRFNKPAGTVHVERNTYVYSTNLSSAGQAQIGTVSTANRLVSDDLDSGAFTSTAASTTTTGTAGLPMIDVTTKTDISGNLTVNNGAGAGELFTETLNANAGGGRAGATLRANDTLNVQVSSTLNTSPAANPTPGRVAIAGANPIVNGGHSYAAVIAKLENGGTINVPTGLAFSTTGSAISAASTRGNDDGDSATALPRMTNIIVNNPAAGAANIANCRDSKKIANGCPNRQFVPAGITPP